MPDSSPTIARREPTIRLNSVDLPTFGRPTMARRGRETVMDEQYPRRDSHPRLSAVMQAVRPAGQPRAGVPTCAVEYYRDSVASTSQPSASAQKKDVSLYQFFSPGGVLSRNHPAYEFRRGQLQMAQAVEQVLGEKRHLIVEAGTGTGKTLAYLMPVIRSGKRVIISTGTKNLQEQLFYKDIPFLEQALFPNGEGKLSVCYMKGRNNYLCRKKLYDLTDTPVLSGLDEIEHYRAIAAWEKNTQTGDRAELASLPEASALWHKLDARADTCLGQKCSSWDRCFITEMHRRTRESAMFFFALLPQGDGRFAFENRREFLEENGEEFLALQHSLGRIGSELENLSSKPEEIFNFVRRAGELQVQLGFLMESDDRNTVFWIERRRGGRDKSNVFLQATPIDVAPILKSCLFDRLECAVLTSATLAVGGGFDYMRRRLGLEQTRELVLASHFDYANQAMFYVPPDLPDPRTPQFAAKAADCIRRLLEITRGRAFVLFTSYAQMNEAYQSLLRELEFPMLLQGDAPKTALLEEFRLTPNAVLFATASFWQGVDVQGEQLSCVIIDRLPFAVPTDPVVAARVKSIDAEGGNAFFQYQVPAAVISLKQGFGRLIRSLHDRGLLVLLDNRILKKAYGRVFVESLPSYQRTTDLRQVEQFFGAQ